MANRSKAREKAVQVLYQVDATDAAPEEALETFSSHFENHEPEISFIHALVQGVLTHREKIDELIGAASEHWRLARMPRIDRVILRLGTYELVFCPDVPPSVVMDEAIELAKKFGDTPTPGFVNGILDRISRRTEKEL